LVQTAQTSQIRLHQAIVNEEEATGEIETDTTTGIHAQDMKTGSTKEAEVGEDQ
jgi:hypothetical protein